MIDILTHKSLFFFSLQSVQQANRLLMSLRNEMSKEDEDWEQLSVLCKSNENLKPVFFAWSSSFFPLLFFSLFVVSLTTSPSKSDCQIFQTKDGENMNEWDIWTRFIAICRCCSKSELLNYLPVHFSSIPHHSGGVHVNGKMSALTSELNNYNLWFMQSSRSFLSYFVCYSCQLVIDFEVPFLKPQIVVTSYAVMLIYFQFCKKKSL